MATEVAFVVPDQGMVRLVCSGSWGNQSNCVNQSFKVEEGDVFVVPRFHPMSQTSFNNDSFVFMGFSPTGKQNYPQYLAGKESVFQFLAFDGKPVKNLKNLAIMVESCEDEFLKSVFQIAVPRERCIKGCNNRHP